MILLYIVLFLLFTLKLCFSENTTCLYETIDLDVEVDCTVDTCSDRYGVKNTPNNSLCPPEKLCDRFLCDIQSGCIAMPKVNCPAQNLCEIPLGCNRETGVCEYDEIDCSDDNECTNDYCDPIIGECVHISNDTICSNKAKDSCNDGNPCTDDYCDYKLGCGSQKKDWNCDSLNACSLGMCTDNGCVQQEVDCDDGNPCSEDFYGCSLPVPIVCNDGNSFSDDICNPSTGCQFTLNNSNCNDEKKCTIDQCGPNGCTHTNVTCPPKRVVDIILIGLICRNHYCDQSTGNCVPDMNSVSLLCI
ncbi:hypothetical protein ACTFIR_004054 [Dictyostelium discoideum]